MQAITPAALSQYQIDQRPEQTRDKELGQEDFLTIMMTQLRNQDPFKPMENGEFLGQMAQFSTVSGIEDMQQALRQLSGAYGTNQTLQATQLIGREVLVEDQAAHLEDKGTVSGRFELTHSTGSVMLAVEDASGRLVRQMDLGEHPAGRHDFNWNGKDEEGNTMPPGKYNISITAATGEKRTAVSVLLARTVDSVEFGNNGDVILNTDDGNVITLDQIRQINQTL